MNAPAARRMNVAEFLDWGEAQEKGRFELVDGQVVAMSPERIGHVRAKQAIWRALADAIEKARLPCEALGDGATVVIDDENAREPDALVQCGRSLDPDSLVADQPVIVVEVLSPSSERADTGEKFADYFSVPSVRHYLIVNPFREVVVHHARSEAGKIESEIVSGGEVEMTPPGIVISIAAVFASARSRGSEA